MCVPLLWLIQQFLMLWLFPLPEELLLQLHYKHTRQPVHLLFLSVFFYLESNNYYQPNAIQEGAKVNVVLAVTLNVSTEFTRDTPKIQGLVVDDNA